VAPDEASIQESAQFIPNIEKQFTVTEFWKENEEDGCDIYIDAVRNMPENVSIVKIIARICDHHHENLMDPQIHFPEIDGSTYQNQRFRTKLEVRGVEMVPSSIVFLTFVTIEATSLKEKVIGTAYFPLFMNPNTKMPCIEIGNIPFNGKRTLHKGQYQMPIYNGMPVEAERFTYQNFISLDRIPCASVLIRVDYSSIDYDGNFISIKDPDPAVAKLAYEEPPKYSEAAYATTYFLTSNVEREMFKKKAVYSTDAPL